MRVHHIAFRTLDLGRLEKFYVETLGLVVKARHDDRSLWLEIGEATLMLEHADEDEPKIPPGSMEFLAFTIFGQEKKAWRARLDQAGVVIEHETDFTMYVRDPDGRRIGLSHFTV
jgi:catechol 2,3-dioxygenase-like lactoylglutathione lyase family enzyme